MGLPLLIPLAISAGGMALQYLFTPRVKQEPVDKGKMDDIRITSSDYGARIPRVWGTCRIGGNLIWTAGITHTIINTPSGGGKGVPQAPATRQHIYQASQAVLICQGEIQRILRMWADADLIINNQEWTADTFEMEDTPPVTRGGSPTPTVETSGTYSGTGWVQITTGGSLTIDLTGIADPTFPTPDPDIIYLPKTEIRYLYKCSADRTADIEADGGIVENHDFLNTGGSWTFKTVITNGFADSILIDAASGIIGFDYAEVQKYWQPEQAPTYKQFNRITGIVNPDIIYPTDPDDVSGYYNFPLADTQDGTTKTYSIQSALLPETQTIYVGNVNQTQDPTMVAWGDETYGIGEGVLRISAHRDLAYIVFANRTLKQARTENYTFEVKTATAATVNSILTDLFEDVGLESGDYTITATAGLSQTGFLEFTDGSRRSLVEALERYHQFRIAEIDGKIKTVLNSTTSIATISADDIRAHEAGEDMPGYDAEVIIREESQMPREVRVSVMNPELEYHNESVVAQLFASLSSTESIEYTFPIVDSPDNARLAAEKLLLQLHTEDKAIEFWGMPTLARYSIGDIITVPVGDETIICRIEKKQMVLPIGKIRFQCVAVSQFSPTYYQSDITNVAKQAPLYAKKSFPRNSVVIPIQSLPLLSGHTGHGVYLAVCGRGRGVSENHTIYREFDTDNYVIQYVTDVPAVAGLCEDTLPTWESGKGTEDTTSVLDIWFFDDIDLESVLQADIDRYPTINLMRVGDEWVQFRTAAAQTLEANSPYRSKWRITNLWRGRFTTDETVAHSADEYAVLYTSAVKWFPLDATDQGEPLVFKAVTSGQAEENAPTTTFTYNKSSNYSVSNGATDRTFDANATTIDELADVLGTVIDDLNL